MLHQKATRETERHAWRTGVQDHVVLEVGVFAEASTTHVALEGPRAAVDVLVALQVARGRERLGAQRTLVRFLLDTVIKPLQPGVGNDLEHNEHL